MFENSPPYGLNRVSHEVDRHLVDKPEEDNDYGVRALTANSFAKLTVAEQFTYCMDYPENYGQNCDGMPAFLQEESSIFAYPCEPFEGTQSWSDRQTNFFHAHRSTVIKLVADTARREHRFGTNAKDLITEIDAYELIPQMVAMYRKDRKDLDLLSTMAVLMKDGKYPPFVHSAVYKLLYGDKDSYQTHIPATVKNRDVIVKDALAFYKSKKK
jgi:hypothetical protein